jgi:hypothetical protein
MTSLPSPSRSKRSISLLPLLLSAIPMLLMAACADKHIGRPCEIGLPADPNQSLVNPQALECPSRICLLPSQDKSLDPTQAATGPFCTDYCSSDDDCSDGETRGKGSGNPNGCIKGFSCRVPIAKLESNPLSCKHVCVCKDFLKDGEGDVIPPTCKH